MGCWVCASLSVYVFCACILGVCSDIKVYMYIYAHAILCTESPIEISVVVYVFCACILGVCSDIKVYMYLYAHAILSTNPSSKSRDFGDVVSGGRGCSAT